VITLACVLIAALPLAEDPKPPDTPAGRQLAACLTAFNSGDADAWRAFISEHFSLEALEREGVDDRLSSFAFVHQDTGGLQLASIESSADHEVVASFRMANGGDDRIRIKLTVEPGPPHGIASVQINRLRTPPSDDPKPKLSDERIAAEVDALIDRLVAADRFSGAVLVVHDGRTIYERAAGDASKAYGVPNRIDTKFNLGSMNKMFTAVAIAQLAEAGKLSYDDPTAKHLPDFPNPEAAGKITIRHLLTHSSGLGSYFGEEWEQRKAKLRSVSDFMAFAADDPLEFQPGERFGYSNTGFLVLGAIVEAASGEDYFTYVKGHIHGPAGMADTDAYELDRETPNLAVGYTRQGLDGKFQPGPWRNNVFLHVIKGGPAGGGYSTAPDLAKFAEALLGGKLVSPSTLEALTSRQIEAGPGGPGGAYGYGFMIDKRRGHRFFGHGGGFPGISSQLDVFPELGYTVVVLSNYDMGAFPVVDALRDLIAR
jgi:CubicO group peptidase (beta-lactamase class C family)